MDITLSEEQRMVREVAKRFLSEYCPPSFVREVGKGEKDVTTELWPKIAELGWLGLVLPDKYGGVGGSLMDLVILMEEMGAVCMPGPFMASSILFASTLLRLGSEKQKQELLPRIASGEIIGTFALEEADCDYEPGGITVKAVECDGGYEITGSKFFVPYANIVNHIICVTKTGSSKEAEKNISVLLIDAKAKGLSYKGLKTISGGNQYYEVVFDKVRIPKENLIGKKGKAWSSIKEVLQYATVAQCAEMVGGGQRVLELAVAYAKIREQFGQVIGSFQAIRHHCANMLVDQDACRWITYKTAWMMEEEMPVTKQVSIAKAWCNEAHRRVIATGHQVFGAIGYSEEHEMPLYFRKARMSEVFFGNANYHKKLIEEELFGGNLT